MPGQMGNTTKTTLSLKVFKIDTKLDLVYVIGAVPGAKNGTVFIRDALRKPLPDGAPYPTFFKGTEYPLPIDEFGEVLMPDVPLYKIN